MGKKSMLISVLKGCMQVCGIVAVVGSGINEFQMELGAMLGSTEAG